MTITNTIVQRPSRRFLSPERPSSELHRESFGAESAAETPAGSEAKSLLERLLAKDERAFEELTREHAPRMLAVAKRFLRHDEDAADAVQEAFLSAFKSLSRFAGDSTLSTWLHRITVNVCLMMIRSKSRRPSLSIDELLPTFDETGHHAVSPGRWGENALDRVCAEETRAQTRSLIERLPAPYREVLLLRDVVEWDTEATARHLNIGVGVVKTRLHRARQALRALLVPLMAGLE